MKRTIWHVFCKIWLLFVTTVQYKFVKRVFPNEIMVWVKGLRVAVITVRRICFLIHIKKRKNNILIIEIIVLMNVAFSTVCLYMRPVVQDDINLVLLQHGLVLSKNICRICGMRTAHGQTDFRKSHSKMTCACGDGTDI